MYVIIYFLLPHPTRGEWIEIHNAQYGYNATLCLTPHGVSGLKSPIPYRTHTHALSHPTRGEWIEISPSLLELHHQPRLTPHGVSGLK